MEEPVVEGLSCLRCAKRSRSGNWSKWQPLSSETKLRAGSDSTKQPACNPPSSARRSCLQPLDRKQHSPEMKPQPQWTTTDRPAAWLSRHRSAEARSRREFRRTKYAGQGSFASVSVYSHVLRTAAALFEDIPCRSR